MALVFCVYFVLFFVFFFWYFMYLGIFGLLLFYVVSIPVQLIAWKTVPEMTYYVSRGTLSNCTFTLSLTIVLLCNRGNDVMMVVDRLKLCLLH